METRKTLGDPLVVDYYLAWFAMSPDGRTLALAEGPDSTMITTLDLETMQPIGSGISLHTDPLTQLVFSPDGETLATGAIDNTIRLLDAETGQLVGAPLRLHTEHMTEILFDPHRKVLASSSYDGTVRIWTLDPKAWRARACLFAGRNFTQQEWSVYLAGYPYRKTCEQWPEGKSGTVPDDEHY
jgi:WD40 repeat protein